MRVLKMLKTKQGEAQKSDQHLLESKRNELGKYLRKRSLNYPKLEKINGLIHLKRNVLPIITGNQEQQDEFTSEVLEFAQGKAGLLDRKDMEFLSFPKKFPLLSEYIDELDLSKTERGWQCECYELCGQSHRE